MRLISPALSSTPSVLSGRMIRVCMYCKQSYGFVPCTPEQDGKETHGICEARECRAQMSADFGYLTFRSKI